MAFQCLAQHRRGIVPKAGRGQQCRRVLACAGVLHQMRDLASKCNRLDHRFDIAVDQRSSAQRNASHRRHVRREVDTGANGVRDIDSDVAVAEGQGEVHEIRGKTAVVVTNLRRGLEAPAAQQHVVRTLRVALGQLELRHCGRHNSRVVAHLVAFYRADDLRHIFLCGLEITRCRGDDRPVGQRL